MARRVDTLLCERPGVREKVNGISKQMRVCASDAKKAISQTVDEMVEALKKREQDLIREVNELADRKLRLLHDQVDRVEQYSVRSGKDEAEEAICLRTDEVINFKTKKQKELLEMIENFGDIDGTSTYSHQSAAAGPLIEGPVKVGFTTWVRITARDLHGKQKKDGGDTIEATFSEDDTGAKQFQCEVEDLDDGTYKVKVVPEAVGVFTLTLAIHHPDGSSQEEIPGSPFQIVVQPPFDYTILGDDTLGQAGTPWVTDDIGFLRRPLGLQFDPTGQYVFVADQNNDRVQVFEHASRKALCSFGRKGIGPCHFNSPGYIVASREDQVVVSDILNHRLQVLRFNRETKLLSHLETVGCQGEGQKQFHFPRGIALSESGLLVVVDSGNSRIQILDSNDHFAFVREFGEHGTEDGRLIKPLDVAVNSLDEIIVTDEHHRVQVFDMNGAFLRTFGTKGRKKNSMFRHPTSITVDNEDSIFVCDQGNHRVQVFNRLGEFLHKWGGLKKEETPEEEERAETPAGEAPDDAKWYGLLMPAGITVAASGVVLVSDHQKHVIFDYFCGPVPIDEKKVPESMDDSPPPDGVTSED